MRKVICILFLLLLAACIPSQSLAVNTRHIVKKSINSSVAIEVNVTGNRWATIGSGTVIRTKNKLYIGSQPRFAVVTAEHVMVGGDGKPMRACADVERTVCIKLGSYLVGGTGPFNYSMDWAVVPFRVLPKPLKPAPVEAESLELGEPVVLIGHPWGTFIVTTGIHASKSIDLRGLPVDILHAYAAPGSSGGGVFDSQGRLRGIVVAIPIRKDPWGNPHLQHDLVWVVPIRNMAW